MKHQNPDPRMREMYLEACYDKTDGKHELIGRLERLRELASKEPYSEPKTETEFAAIQDAVLTGRPIKEGATATPRTDANLEVCNVSVWPAGKYVEADFARQLERDLAVLQRAVEETVKQWKALRGLQRTNCGADFTSAMSNLYHLAATLPRVHGAQQEEEGV